MLLDEGMDTGPVIAQHLYTMTGEETAGELTDTLFDMGAAAVGGQPGSVDSGELQAHPQDNALATVTRKLERTDGLQPTGRSRRRRWPAGAAPTLPGRGCTLSGKARPSSCWNDIATAGLRKS